MSVELNVWWWLLSLSVLTTCGFMIGLICERANRKAELRALHRYRTACQLAGRWNGQCPNSAETAEWINDVGEGKRGMDIERFRERLRAGEGARHG